MTDHCPTLALAHELINRQSITPEDGGCQQLLAQRLADCGFVTEHLHCNGVDNLWAVFGSEGPLLCLVGHTDVVPTGDLNQWRYPPFVATVSDGNLYGRGSADMKGSVAAMVTACERVVSEAGSSLSGRLAIMLTSDEEGPATDGVRYVTDQLLQRGIKPTWCLIGEPSCDKQFGDTIKTGRRGSLTGYLKVKGVQGHIAYPHKADNPILKSAPVLAELAACQWDSGNRDFPPTSLQFSQFSSNSGADNVIPGQLQACFNFRFSTAVTELELRSKTEAILDKYALNYELKWHLSGKPFLSQKGPLIETLTRTVATHTGITPGHSTSGGTSDGRHLAVTGAEIAEFGPLNSTIHKIDECVSCDDLRCLSLIYQEVIETLLAKDAADDRTTA